MVYKCTVLKYSSTNSTELSECYSFVQINILPALKIVYSNHNIWVILILDFRFRPETVKGLVVKENFYYIFLTLH